MLSYLHRNSYDSVPLLAEKYYFDLSSGEAPDWFIESKIPERQLSIYSHNHSEPELIYVIRGNMKFNLNNQPLTIGAGDLMIVNPFDFHEAFFNRNEIVEYCYLIFDLSCLSGCGNTVGDKLTALKYGKQRFPDVLYSADSLTCAIGELIQHLCGGGVSPRAMSSIIPAPPFVCGQSNIHRHTDGGSDDILKISLLCGIMSMLYDRIEPVSGKRCARDIGFIQRLTEYIDDNLKHPLTTASVSAEFGYSESYFCTLFKRNFGHSFTNYLNNVRISRIIDDYPHSKKTLSETIALFGFTDYCYFSRCFKRHTGVSPSIFFVNKRQK